MTERDEFNTPALWGVALMSAAVTLVLILAIRLMYVQFVAKEVQRKVIDQPVVEAKTHVAQQEAALSRYGWSDRAAGRAVIPIERAMKLVVEEGGRIERNGPVSAVDDLQNGQQDDAKDDADDAEGNSS